MTLQQLVSFFGAFGLKISADDNGNVLLDASGNGRQGQLYLGNVKNLDPYSYKAFVNAARELGILEV